ncbi:hypothetical protein PIB30_116115, partial [Stylosanthes scabra]|nr:hypothetical protein [Stylosanthes scabra]
SLTKLLTSAVIITWLHRTWMTTMNKMRKQKTKRRVNLMKMSLAQRMKTTMKLTYTRRVVTTT